MAISKLTGKSLDLGTDAIESFASTGIDDNATSTTLTINADGSIVVSDKVQVGGSTGNAYKIYANSDESNQIIGAFNQQAQDSGYITVSANGTTNFAQVRLGANADDMVLFAGGSESMRIDASGNVGIGTTSPASLLEVSSDTGTTPTSPSEIRISTTTSGSSWSQTAPWGQLSFYSADTSYGGAKVQAAVAATADASLGALSRLGFFLSPSGGSLTEYMSVTHYGHVGVGTSSPVGVFHVQTTEASTGVTDPIVRFERFTTGDNAYLDITIDNANNLVGFQSTGTNDGDFTFGGATSETVRITASGRIGIGNTDPISAIHIFDQNNSSNMRRVAIESTSNAGANGGYRLVLNSANGTQRAGGYYFVPGNTDTTTYLGLSSTDSDYALVATRENKVGIGTTSPSQKLTVNGLMSFGSTLGDIISLYDNRINGTNMYGFGVESSTLYYKAQGYHRWYINQNANSTDWEMELRDQGRLNLRSTTSSGPQLYFLDDSSPGLVGNIKFTGSFGNGGSYNAGLQGSGEIHYSAAGHFFADTSVVSYGIPGAWHRMNGDFRWGTYSGSTIITEAILMASSTGNLDIDGTLYQNSASTNSDAKMKENVVTLTDCLNKVSQLRGVEFDWKSEYRRDAGHDIGVIAQEVETVIPEIVTERDLQVGIKGNDGETIKSVDYSKFTAVLIEAVKELKTQNEALEARIATLESS